MNAQRRWGSTADPAQRRAVAVLAGLVWLVGLVVAPPAMAADVTGILADGVPFTVTTTQPGQQVRLSIPARSATAAAPVLQISDFTSTTQSFGGYTQVQIEQGGVFARAVVQMFPGTTSWTEQLNTGMGGTVDLTQPSTLVFLPNDATATMSFTVKITQPKATTVVVRSGQTVTASFAGPGDQTQLVFTPKVGQHVLLHVSADTVGARPALTSAAGGSFYGNPIPEAPDYWEFGPGADGSTQTLTVTAPLTATGSVTLTLTVVTDPTYRADGTTTIRWAAAQNPQVRFTGKAGTRPVVLLSIPTGATWTAVNTVVSDSSGAAVSFPEDGLSPGTRIVSFSQPLPATGTYTLTFDPVGLAPGTLTAKVLQVSDQHLTATSGKTVDLKVTTPGQRIYITIGGQSGQYLTWNLRDSTITSTTLQLWWGPAPDGMILDQTTAGPGNRTGTLSPWQPLITDNYTVILDPLGRATGKLELTLTNTNQPVA